MVDEQAGSLVLVSMCYWGSFIATWQRAPKQSRNGLKCNRFELCNSHDTLVGSAAFKGKPKEGRVEIAYGVFPHYQNQGIGTEICGQLVLLALETDPTVIVTARTLPEENYSTRILRKNNFAFGMTKMVRYGNGTIKEQYL
jgi:RimJ/RimL family protein N-acetyltransferase